MSSPASFRFGDFAWICNRASLTLCPALNLSDPECYSRNVGFKYFLIFQPSVLAVDVAGILMTMIMIFHIRSKYTAVGRKEMVIFFYLYLVTLLFELVLSTNILPLSIGIYKYAAAGHIAAITTSFSMLFFNGFVGFQWAEDGTTSSVWSFRILALMVAAGSYFVAISTFLGFAGMSPNNTVVLFCMLFIYNAAVLFLYVILQLILVLRTLHDRWPVGDIFFGLIFFGLSMTATFAFSNHLCIFASHYVDGMFLGSGFLLLSVMMVYKYWDSITTEDLEFSVGGTPQVWHLQNTMGMTSK